MKLRNVLDDLFDQKIKIKALRCLILKQAEITGRQLATEIGTTPPTLHRALKTLVQARIVLQRKSGKAFIFKINPGSLLTKKLLLPLFTEESAFLSGALSSILKKNPVNLLSAILYGSAAKGTDTVQSDIDLMLVVKKSDMARAEKYFNDAAIHFGKDFNRTLAPYITSASTFTNKYRARNPLLVEVVKTGMVIKGWPISKILKYGSQKN
jgi:predicted nucleotidyltransferase